MAKKKKGELTPNEAAYIKQRETTVASIIDAIERVSKFKEGDYLIAFQTRGSWGNARREPVTNSYGAPKKFMVVHTDRFNIPYIKEINKHGTPVGQLISPLKLDDDYNARFEASDYIFEVDPDYTDAIIFEDEANFDAAQLHKAKADLFKDITEHNKSLKVNCNDSKELITFLQSLKVGDVIWKSIKTSYTILTLDPIPTSHNGSRLIEGKVFGTAQTSKGKIIELDNRTFKWSAIYKGQPRSYNELKDPK